ncbi:GntR family transcriptional regulator [Kumtagia ephedrae]|jgi:DNA-binding GntR family transcriptional regulator|uniref:GntR family transcriptional regulator n=1 Tax=Kumtagia ephedrae TaxID=2116701 RepID=A0A2P7S284_9HYPH|nr:GntR family transcriptional regulator [Mesorhizobium ephedrae]PSJ56536.1 GntR family transcriptional regulator [Mesorhizobium ephedrae]
MSKTSIVFKQTYNRCLHLLEGCESLPSEPELGLTLGVSRTTVRAVLTQLEGTRLISWNKRSKVRLREPCIADFYPAEETDSPADIVERGFMRRLLAQGVEPGTQLTEAELARDMGVGASSVREFLIRFSRFGLIEKRPKSRWRFKGFTRDFALELIEIREMFELRSAFAFTTLAEENPAWAALDRIEAEHHALAASMATRYGDFSELDERFHRLIHNASRNRFIIDFYDVIAMIFHYHYQWNKVGERERNASAVAEHLAYAEALRSRDRGRVQAACGAHLTSARNTLLDSVPSRV